jgi:hypothetical protein
MPEDLCQKPPHSVPLCGTALILQGAEGRILFMFYGCCTATRVTDKGDSAQPLAVRKRTLQSQKRTIFAALPVEPGIVNPPRFSKLGVQRTLVCRLPQAG